MKSFVCTVFCFLSSLFAQAQFSDSITQHIRLTASGNLNRSNNATSYLLSNEARYSIRNKRTTLNTAANWLYGELGSRLTNNDFTTTVDFNLYRDSSNLYYWGVGQFYYELFTEDPEPVAGWFGRRLQYCQYIHRLA